MKHLFRKHLPHDIPIKSNHNVHDVIEQKYYLTLNFKKYEYPFIALYIKILTLRVFFLHKEDSDAKYQTLMLKSTLSDFFTLSVSFTLKLDLYDINNIQIKDKNLFSNQHSILFDLSRLSHSDYVSSTVKTYANERLLLTDVTQ